MTDTSSVESQIPKSKISRREFLKLAGITAAGFLTGCLPKEGEIELPTRRTLLEPIEPREGSIPFRLEGVEMDLPNSPQWFPDTRTSFLKDKNKYVLYGSAGTDGIRMEGNSLNSLQIPVRVLGPDRRVIENLGVNGYRAFGGVFEGRNENELVGIYHEEFWPSLSDHMPFNAQIGISLSRDKGKTWENQTDPITIITGDQMDSEARNVRGAGQPSPLVTKDGMVYVYYTNWGIGSANICVARAPLSSVDNPDSWKKWHNGGFDSPAIGGPGTPVIKSPDGAAALVGVSWNTKLNKFLAILERGFEGDSSGFYITTSTDGINWGEQQMIAKFPKPLAPRSNGEDWYSYPSLISDTDNQFITSGEGVLLCSRGVEGQRPHTGILIPFKIG